MSKSLSHEGWSGVWVVVGIGSGIGAATLGHQIESFDVQTFMVSIWAMLSVHSFIKLIYHQWRDSGGGE